MVRCKLDYKRHCRVEPGTYWEVHDEPIPSNTMAPRTHSAIALIGPTGNMQGSLKFYSLTTGRVLKQCSFIPMAMPDRVIKRVNSIGLHEQQDREFRFLNWRQEPYEWTDEVSEDDPDFQGLLEEPAPYPDLSSELPGVLLKDEEADLHVVTDEPESDFAELAAAALDNAGINANGCLLAVQQATLPYPGPALIKTNDDEIMYEITFDMPDVGLVANNVVPAGATPPGATTVNNLARETVDILMDTGDSMRPYPTGLCRSVTQYTPQTTFLQLEEVRAHRSVINAVRNIKATKEERVHATTWTGTS